MMPLDERDAFRRGDDADDADRFGAGLAQQIQAGDGAAAGREHRVDHQHVAGAEIQRQLRVVLRGDGRHLVALETDVADARAGDQLEDGVEHPEAGAKNGNDDDIGADAASRRGTDRRVDGDILRRQIARRLGREQHADARRGAAEQFRRRTFVTQRDERVVHEWMVDEVIGHGETIHRGDRIPARCVTN